MSDDDREVLDIGDEPEEDLAEGDLEEEEFRPRAGAETREPEGW